MNLKPNQQKMSRKGGFTMIELLCAIVVLNLLVAGLASMFCGQNQIVNSLEEWCEGDPVLYVAPDSSPLARTLGVPATLSKKRSKGEIRRTEETLYEVEVLQMRRRFAKNEASVVFSQIKSENDKDDKGDENDKNDKNDENEDEEDS